MQEDESKFFDDQANVKHALFAYLLLAGLDTIHHLHVALGLGNPSGYHAVWTAVVLVPVAVILVVVHLRYKWRICFWGFLAIAWSATLMLGWYHGGWDHLIKILAFVRLEVESTDIKLLFPADNWHLWFYEISGVAEFFLGVVTAYTLSKFIRARRDPAASVRT